MPARKPPSIPAIVTGGTLVAVVVLAIAGSMTGRTIPAGHVRTVEPSPARIPPPYVPPVRAQEPAPASTPAPVVDRAASVTAWVDELQRIQSTVDTHLGFVDGDRRRMEAAAARGNVDDASFWKESMLQYARLTLGYMEEGVAHMGTPPVGIDRAELDQRFGAARRELQQTATAFRAEIERMDDPGRESRRQRALEEALRMLEGR